MKSKRFVVKTILDFYEEVTQKRKKKPMRLQTDQEFTQKWNKKLKQKIQCSNVFSECQKRKAFDAEQQIR